MSMEDKMDLEVEHVDDASFTAKDAHEGNVTEAQLQQIIDKEHTQTYREVWRTHKKALLWSIGVSWVSHIYRSTLQI